MTPIDITIVSVYLAALFAFGIWTGLREDAEAFLVASRSVSLPLAVGSVVSTWVGTGTTIATASAGFSSGISLGATAAAGGLVGVLAAAALTPRIKRFGDTSGAHTIGDFFGHRYSLAARLVAAGVIIVVYLMLLAGQFVGMATVLKVWGGLAVETALAFAAGSTIAYTAFAGIKSDFYTDAIHFGIMVVVLLGLLPYEIGTASPDSPGLSSLPSAHFDVFAYGGVSFFVAGILFGVAGVFVTMELWQRIYATRDAKSAQRTLVLSGVIIVVFYAISTYYGLVARAVAPTLVNPDEALFVVFRRYLRTGYLGLGVAAFLAVCVSTINSMIMVVSATLTKDVYVAWVRPSAVSRQILRTGRILTMIVGIVGLALAWAVRDIVALTVNSLFSLLILLPAILGGFYWPRATAAGATWSMVSGAVTLCALTPLAPTQAFVPAFLVSAVVFVVVSMRTVHATAEGSL